MKTIIVIFFVMVTLALGDGTNYGNIVTLNTANVLPAHISLETQDIAYPSLKQLRQAGWRDIVAIEQPASGWVVRARVVTPIDNTTCQLLISDQVTQASIDDEAGIAAAQKHIWETNAVANIADSDPIQFATIYYLTRCMVASGVTNNLSNAKKAILDKAWSKM